MVTNNAAIFKTVITDNEHSVRVQNNVSDAFNRINASFTSSINQTNSTVSGLSATLALITAMSALSQTRSGHIKTGYGIYPDSASLTAGSSEYLLYTGMFPSGHLSSFSVSDPLLGSFTPTETVLLSGCIFPGQTIAWATASSSGDLFYLGFNSVAIG